MHALTPGAKLSLSAIAASPLEHHTRPARPSAPASVAMGPCRTLDHPGAFAGLRSKPLKQASTAQLAPRAGAIASHPSRAENIDPARVDLAAAIAEADLKSDRPQARQDLSTLNTQRRVVLECMRACAGEAYTADLATVPDIGKLQFDAQMSSPRLKLWHGTSGDALTMVLGFSGTRMEEAEDLLCDVKSQLTEPHANSFDQHLPTLGDVGSGWQEWWKSEAELPREDGDCMKEVLTRYAQMAKEGGKALSVSLAGHSLGAAVATLAGFDITHFLRATGVNGKVSVYAFNPPRMGSQGIESQYKGTLAEPSASEASPLSFSLRQFTRNMDPIQSVPLFMHHPHWGHEAARGSGSTTEVSGDRFANFVTCTDQATSHVNLSLNHELSGWRDYFTSQIGDGELKSIFEAPHEPATAAPAPPLSRRQLLTSMFPSPEG